MNRYKAFDLRTSIFAIVATLFVSTSSLLVAAGPLDASTAAATPAIVLTA